MPAKSKPYSLIPKTDDMIVAGNKRAEARCRYYVREEARRLGWDVRHPKAGGRFLEEQEIVDYYPPLKGVLGANRPDFGAIGGDDQLRIIIECKNEVKDIEKATAEACEYAEDINNTIPFDVRIAVGVAGSPDRFVQTRGLFLRQNEWVSLESHGWPLTQLPTLAELDTAITKADGTTDVQLPDEREFADATIAINNILRLSRIEESVRPRVLGAIILALYQGEFSLDHRTVIDHMNANVSAAVATFNDLQPDHRDHLRRMLTLSAESFPLRDRIELIIHQLERLNVRSIVRSGVDFLGKFYEAFLRYGSDATKMGIVFTPRHITQFCANLIDVRVGMSAYDPAAGTGGFLVAAYDKMMKEATTPTAQSIVKKSIYGCDTNPTVWALAVLNMFFRGDGKSNILFKSCFDDQDSVRGRFDRVLLNPPFSQEGEPETDFIDHGLLSLKPGSLMAVVVKINVLVDDKLSGWRKRLVGDHHVLGVISLPVDLFYPTSVPTAIILVRAHTPSLGRGVFLARIENDGYEISKKRRVPRAGSQIGDMLKLFRQFLERGDVDTIPNVACMVSRKAISGGEEICAERWLPSGVFGLEQFEQRRAELTRQMSLAVTNYPDVVDELIDNYEDLLADAPAAERPSARTVLSYWFSVTMGKSTGSSNYPEGTIPYVSSGDSYNGIVTFVQPPAVQVYDTPCISVTAFGQAYIQPWRFCARGNGGSAVRILRPQHSMTLAELIWFAGQINSQRWRFLYGRMAIRSRLNRLEVDPPPDTLPDITGLANRLHSFRAGLAVLSKTTSERDDNIVVARFNQLVNEWKAGRGPTSSVTRMAMHPAYQRIIGLGKDAIPLLLAEMEHRPSHWAWALRAITGVDPVPDASRGKLFETAKAWLQWGKEQGYQW